MASLKKDVGKIDKAMTLVQQVDEAEMDRCIQLNRSVSLFFAITRIMILLAALILITSNRDTVYVFLSVQMEKAKAIDHIAVIFVHIFAIVLAMCILTSIIGIYGFSTLNRHFLSAYGGLTLIEVIWAVYFIIAAYNREETNFNKVHLFKDYKFSRSAQRMVNIIQRNQKCCGSTDYKYDDLAILPVTCCERNHTKWYCTKQEAYNQTCSTSRHTLHGALNAAHFQTIIPLLIVLFFLLALAVAGLAFDMVKRLGESTED